MQGSWHYGKGLIFLRPIFFANKISLPQGQSRLPFSVALALRMANFVYRNIGLK